MSTRIAVQQGVMDITVNLTAMDCPNCAVVFAVPDRLERERREDGQSFYCPNGHGMSYSGEMAKLKAKLVDKERDLVWFKTAEREARDRANETERRLRAQKGNVTKLRKRLVAGACPFGCRRHFANLERHIAGQHPAQNLPMEADSDSKI